MNPITSQHIVNKALTIVNTLPPDLLLAYIQDLLRWNPQLGLVSRKDPLAAVERLVLESAELLALARALDPGGSVRCLDVGSGGGFPGLVWALAMPAWSFTLVERKVGRAAFLQAEVLRLGLGNVQTLASSIEDASSELHPGFDIGVAMAVATPAALSPAMTPLLAVGGLFLGTCPAGLEHPPQIGKSLDLEGHKAGDYGNYVWYRRSE